MKGLKFYCSRATYATRQQKTIQSQTPTNRACPCSKSPTITITTTTPPFPRSPGTDTRRTTRRSRERKQESRPCEEKNQSLPPALSPLYPSPLSLSIFAVAVRCSLSPLIKKTRKKGDTRREQYALTMQFPSRKNKDDNKASLPPLLPLGACRRETVTGVTRRASR